MYKAEREKVRGHYPEVRSTAELTRHQPVTKRKKSQGRTTATWTQTTIASFPQLTREINHDALQTQWTIMQCRALETGLCLRSSRTSPVPELSFLPTPYRGWTRAGERRVQDNLHAHAQNEPMKNYWSQPRCSRQCVAQCLFQLALWKKTFSLTLILS